MKRCRPISSTARRGGAEQVAHLCPADHVCMQAATTAGLGAVTCVSVAAFDSAWSVLLSGKHGKHGDAQFSDDATIVAYDSLSADDSTGSVSAEQMLSFDAPPDMKTFTSLSIALVDIESMQLLYPAAPIAIVGVREDGGEDALSTITDSAAFEDASSPTAVVVDDWPAGTVYRHFKVRIVAFADKLDAADGSAVAPSSNALPTTPSTDTMTGPGGLVRRFVFRRMKSIFAGKRLTSGFGKGVGWGWRRRGYLRPRSWGFDAPVHWRPRIRIGGVQRGRRGAMRMFRGPRFEL